MVIPVKKPWQHPPIRSPITGEAGKWESTAGRDIFVPVAEMDPDEIGHDELERWLHPKPTYRSTDSKPDPNIEGVEEELRKQPIPTKGPRPGEIEKPGTGEAPGSNRIVPGASVTTPDKQSSPKLFGDPIENLDSGVGKEQGYGNLDLAFVQGRGDNDIGGQDSETYIGSQEDNHKRKIDMNKITHTKVGDDIHFYVNGKEDRGIVVKMGNSFIQVFTESGTLQDIHINDTFFVKDILLNKTWDDMDSGERYHALQKIHAPSPRFITKSWYDLPIEIQELLTKESGTYFEGGAGSGFTYEPGVTRGAESMDHVRTGMQQNTQYDTNVKDKDESPKAGRAGNGIGRNARFGQAGKSDVELQHDPEGPMLGGIVTNFEPLDAEPDYEGETHDPKFEQFKHKEDGAEFDPATGKKKEGGFQSIYGPHTGTPGRDSKYGDKKSGITGVPDYNVNTFGINYSTVKYHEGKPHDKKDDKDAKEEE